MITEQQVIHFLQHSAGPGWALKEQAPKNNTWHLVYRAPRRDFDTYLTWNEDWVSFQASISRDPLVPIRKECKAALFEYLLRLNEEIYLARFGVDENGRVLLIVDLSSQNCNLADFKRGIEAISAYSHRYHLEIQNVLEDSTVAHFVLNHEWMVPAQPSKTTSLTIANPITEPGEERNGENRS
jgi:hypothetical protein